jgi:hypothetical protein
MNPTPSPSNVPAREIRAPGLAAPDAPTTPANAGARRIPPWLWATFALVTVAQIVTVFWPVWRRAAAYRYSNYDIGIYSQALHAIRLNDLNPWLTLRQFPVFCDHFDLILAVPAIPAKLFPPDYTGLAWEHLMALLAAALLLIQARRRPDQAPLVAAGMVYVCFNRAAISALQYPFHPITWSVPLLVALGLAVQADRARWIVALTVLLCGYREENALALMALAGHYLVVRRWRLGLIMLVAAGAIAAFIFGIRPRLWGQTESYLGVELAAWLRDPLAAARTMLGGLRHADRLVRAVIPLIPLVIWVARNRVPPAGPLLSYLGPLLAFRMVARKWRHHHLAPVGPLLLMALWPRQGPPVPRRVAVWIVGLTLALSAKDVLQGFSWPRPEPRARLFSGDAARVEALNGARAHLLAHPEGDAIVGGNIVPRLVARPGLYAVGGPHRRGERVFRYVLVERPPSGDPWPLSYADIEALIAKWRSTPGARILRDDERLFFAEGAFRD